MDMKDLGIEISDRAREALTISDHIQNALAITEPMREALAISDRIHNMLEVPMREALAVSDRIQEAISEPMREARAISDRMAEVLSSSIGEPVGKLMPELPEPILYDSPVLKAIPQRQTPAAETIETIVRMWEQRRREIENTNQEAFVKVTRPDGRAMLLKSLTAQGENLIEMHGHFASDEEGSIIVGASAFQVEIITLERPATRPDLRIVD